MDVVLWTTKRRRRKGEEDCASVRGKKEEEKDGGERERKREREAWATYDELPPAPPAAVTEGSAKGLSPSIIGQLWRDPSLEWISLCCWN